jgi:hypothetical protein
LGRGAREGFGCDDTRKARQRLELNIVVLPDIQSSASAPYAWLGFLARWGQKERGINTGPTELATVLLLTITVVGIPFAIHRFIRWSLFAEACMLDDLSATESLRRSSEPVKGRWWRTFGFTVLIDVLTILSGPLLGIELLLLTTTLNFINLAASLVYTFTVPYAAIELTLYYFDLEVRGAADTEDHAGVPDRSARVPSGLGLLSDDTPPV